jgi:hypothetical protein
MTAGPPTEAEIRAINLIEARYFTIIALNTIVATLALAVLCIEQDMLACKYADLVSQVPFTSLYVPQILKEEAEENGIRVLEPPEEAMRW